MVQGSGHSDLTTAASATSNSSKIKFGAEKNFIDPRKPQTTERYIFNPVEIQIK